MSHGKDTLIYWLPSKAMPFEVAKDHNIQMESMATQANAMNVDKTNYHNLDDEFLKTQSISELINIIEINHIIQSDERKKIIEELASRWEQFDSQNTMGISIIGLNELLKLEYYPRSVNGIFGRTIEDTLGTIFYQVFKDYNSVDCFIELFSLLRCELIHPCIMALICELKQCKILRNTNYSICEAIINAYVAYGSSKYTQSNRHTDVILNSENIDEHDIIYENQNI